jgi:hypothetical protein
MISKGQMSTAILITCIAMVVGMGLTMFQKEKPIDHEVKPLDWKPFLSLVMMTGMFTLIILGLGEAVKIFINLT